MASDMEQLKKELQNLDNVIQGEFKSASASHAKMNRRIRFDGDVNIIAMAGLMVTILALVYQVATWTTQVNMKLDVMTNLMAQTAENTKDIKELREREYLFLKSRPQ